MYTRDPQCLFDEVLSLLPGERTSFLTRACAGDSTLRSEVERLLSDYEHAQEFFRELGARIAVQPAGTHAPSSFSHYRCLEKIGAGGMGVVYKAYDSRLNRIVAVKLLRSCLSSDEHARARFLQEARAASAIDHPNICAVHEMGEIGEGQFFIAMPFYEGRTLQNRVASERVPTEELTAWARQIAEGLEAAHSRGIIHRDIKPANLLVTDAPGARHGLVKILDFGVAKIAGLEFTKAAAPLGTVAYMSPEQTRGDTVDHRSDIWSVGVVLYELLTGVRPFRGESDEVVLYSIRHDVPEPVRKLRPDAPAALARIVDRCLQKHAARRYQSAGALQAALTALETASYCSRGESFPWTGGGAFATVLLMFVCLFVWPGYRVWNRSPQPAGQAAVAGAKIAVLPLTNRSSNPADALFADIITEELISRLSRFHALRVIGTRSVREFRSTTKDPDQIGRKLGVQSLVQGDIGKTGDSFHLRLRLIDTKYQRTIWSEEYAGDSGSISGLCSQIAARVAALLGAEVQRVQRRDAVEARAWTPYLKGQYFVSKRDKQSLWNAKDSFQKAIDLDPAFSEAWAGLAKSYLLLGSYGWITASEAGARARSAAQRALALDNDVPEAHAALASTLQQYEWDREGAGRHFRRAIELNPSYASARQWYSEHLWSVRRFDEAIAEARKARELDPLALPAQLSVGIALYMAGRFDEAISEYQQLLAIDPDHTLTNFYLGLTYVAQKQYDKAIAQFRKVGQQWGYGPDAASGLGSVYARTGRPDEARKMLGVLEQLSRKQQVSPFYPAMILFRLGEKERAFELLNRAADAHTWHVQLFDVEPALHEMRADPRFQLLLKRTGYR